MLRSDSLDRLSRWTISLHFPGRTGFLIGLAGLPDQVVDIQARRRLEWIGMIGRRRIFSGNGRGHYVGSRQVFHGGPGWRNPVFSGGRSLPWRGFRHHGFAGNGNEQEPGITGSGNRFGARMVLQDEIKKKQCATATATNPGSELPLRDNSIMQATDIYETASISAA